MSIRREDFLQEAKARRDRVEAMMKGSPPMSVRMMAEREGVQEQTIRKIIVDMGADGERYFTLQVRTPKSELPFGLTTATAQLRQRLGDHLYMLRQRSAKGEIGRHAVAAKVGVTNREQLKAEQRPFNYDWTLSQIERLARELGRDPRELIMSCLNG